jgi:hypothetical protein
MLGAGGMGALGLTAVASSSMASAAFMHGVREDVGRLFRDARPPSTAPIRENDLAGLPAPVQRMLHRAGAVGATMPSTVRLRQRGTFRLREEAPWGAFTAEEYFTTDPPGFIWVAAMKPAPLVSIVGRDRFIDGHGNMDIRLWALFRVANASGPEVDQGALLRYLNETMWFPAAALSRYMTWDAVDDASARATMSYAGATVRATFFIDPVGRLTNVVADRYRYTAGSYSLDRWSTPIFEYGEWNGIFVPTGGEGVWKLEGGDFPYIRLRVVDLEYDQPLVYPRRHCNAFKDRAA